MLANLIKKRAWVVITLTIALTVFFGLFIKNVGVESDVTSFLPPSDPIVQQFNKIGKKFGGNTIAMVMIESDSIFSFPVLFKIRELEESYKKIEGVGFTQSLVSIINERKVEDGIEVSPLIGEKIPRKKEVLDSLKQYVLSKDLYNGSIISNDGRYTVIFARIKEGYDRNKIGLEIRKITDQKKGNLKIYYSGLPLTMTFINEIITGDVKKLLPITLLLVIIVLGFGFRRPAGVMLPISSVLFATIWTVGIMGIFHRNFSIVSNLIPVLLISVGSAYGIHIINRFYEDHDIGNTIKHIALPVVLAALTTMVSFLSFLSSNLIPIREFGIFSAIGVVSALIISLMFIPSVLHLTHRKGRREEKSIHLSRKAIAPISKVVISFKRYFIIVGGALFAITILFSPTIKRSVNILEYFKPGSMIRKSIKIGDEHFGGASPIMLYVKGDLTDPSVLNTIEYIEKYMETLPFVSHPQSIGDLLMETNYNLNNLYVIPEKKNKIQNLYFFLEGQDILSMMINDERNEGLVQANLGTEKIGEIELVVNKVEKFIKGLKNKKDWYRDELQWDLKYAGIKEVDVSMVKTPYVPEDVIKEGIMKYLNSEDAAVVLSNNIKKRVVYAAIKNNFEEIKRIGGRDGEYLLKDIKTIIEDVNISYSIKTMYNALVKVNLPEDKRKRIEGDLYWFLKGKDISLSPSKVSIVQTGMPRIHIRLDKKLLSSLFESMTIAIILVFLLLVWQLKSFQGAFFSIIPILFTVTLNFGIMELFRIPLDDATMLISSLAIGMGIDYVIHFTNRLKQEIAIGRDLESAVSETIETSGLAILINAFSVAVGFLALLGANLVPLQRFGILVAGTMLVSSLSAITMLPALILRFRPAYIEKIKNNKNLEV